VVRWDRRADQRTLWITLRREEAITLILATRLGLVDGVGDWESTQVILCSFGEAVCQQVLI
jgi:hypothetical protein